MAHVYNAQLFPRESKTQSVQIVLAWPTCHSPSGGAVHLDLTVLFSLPFYVDTFTKMGKGSSISLSKDEVMWQSLMSCSVLDLGPVIYYRSLVNS